MSRRAQLRAFVTINHWAHDNKCSVPKVNSIREIPDILHVQIIHPRVGLIKATISFSLDESYSHFDVYKQLERQVEIRLVMRS